jgi:hypothetical protein
LRILLTVARLEANWCSAASSLHSEFLSIVFCKRRFAVVSKLPSKTCQFNISL